MSSRIAVRLSALIPLLCIASAGSRTPRAANVHLTMATLHAAALTAPRTAADSIDQPFFLVSILGPRTTTETMQLPASGHLRIHRDEALGARPLVDLSVAPGDTVRLLVSVLEGPKVQAVDEATAARASTKALSQSASARAATVASALAPVLGDGAHWLGSAILVLTNDGGTPYWRALECVATCSVVSGANAVPLPASSAAPTAGVVALSGAGATYHMQLQGQRAP
jgi:hypothetical protein